MLCCKNIFFKFSLMKMKSKVVFLLFSCAFHLFFPQRNSKLTCNGLLFEPHVNNVMFPLFVKDE